jgi:6-pyruvoyltetrahydropterin/6-carboxytetrahydropterin synthase
MVTVKGEPDPETGFVMDLKILSRIIEENILQKLDHKNINLEVDFMKGKLASTENLAIGIWEEIEPLVRTSGAKLHSIRLEETENNIVEYFGNE